MNPIRAIACCVTASLTAALSAQPPAGGAPGDVLPFKATETTLANGLKVIVVPTGFPNLVSLQIPVQTGSRNEVEPGKSGFAHFFEHLMFRGTPETPPEKFRQIMSSAGSRDNASTGDDFTRYYATFAKEDLETVLATYADMFRNLAYSEADFRTEARAILGEYNKNSAEPLQKLFEVQRERFFKAHTYRHTTMGFIRDIENMPNEYAYSKLFFERWYRPHYTTVIVAGDVTADKVLPMIEKHWGGWKGGASAATTEIPKEPPQKAAQYVHVPWASDTLPWVTVGYLGPAFDEHSKDSAAMDLLSALYFGSTSELYKKLVVNEQKVDALAADTPSNVDSSLFTVLARVKSPADALYVRDQILATIAETRARPIAAERLADAKSFNKYSFARTLDSTERIAAVVSATAPYRRSFDTINNFYRTVDSLTPADLQASAKKYFVDNSLIVTTLSKATLPAGIGTLPSLETMTPAPVPAAAAKPAVTPARGAADTSAVVHIPVIQQPSPLPQLSVKLLFTVGSAHDPAGKEGLAALTAAMMTDAGSKTMTIDQIEAALYPMAAGFLNQVDKEVTTFTAIVHKDNWQPFLGIVLPQLLESGFREEDFKRLKDLQINALTEDLRSNNEEELGKERLQTNIFRGTPYGHVTLGTVAGLNAITLADVRDFTRRMYTRANLTLGVSGDVPPEMLRTVQANLARLPEGPAAGKPSVRGQRPPGLHVEILEKDTRATAISFGFPIDVTRAHPDFAALSVARAWLGEHRASSGQLFQRLREVRGMNYGDYAYIEAFPRGMFQFFPDPNLVRQQQIFEIWIRPVVPANAHMALRIAIHELQNLVEKGMTPEDFESTRNYLMKNVYVMTARQDQQLGYALDSKWYGIGDFTEHMRSALQKMTVTDVNAAVKKHLTAKDLLVVFITKDAAALKQALASDAPSSIKYDGEQPKALLEEDRVIGALKLNVPADRIAITPIADVFVR